MPNHVTNRIRISATIGLDEFKKKISTVSDQEYRPIDFEKIIPPPDNMFTDNLGSNEREQCAREGRPNWYDWQTENWGTKWNAYSAHVESEWDGGDCCEMEIHFDTAWSAPFPIIEALRAMDEVDGVWGHYIEEFAESAGVFR